MKLKKSLLSSAVAASLGIGAMATSASVSATIIEMSFTGAFTMLDPAGAPFNNTAPSIQDDGWYGWRSAVSGSMTLNTVTGAGTGTFSSFSFAANGLAVATAMTVQMIGDGMGNPVGTLVLGNMGFNWGGNNGIPVSIVLDASGLLNTLTNPLCVVGCIVNGLGASPASNNAVFGTGKNTYTLPLGPAPIATTTWNTTDIGAVVLGTNPSGTLPLIADTVVNTKCDVTVAPFNCTGLGGSPMKAGPFNSWNANFDILSLEVTGISLLPPPEAVPIPAAAWLFGSGLLGLAAVARRKKKGDAS
jgi:hypothetical protein